MWGCFLLENLKKLLDVAYSMEKIYEKLKQEETNKLYYELLEDLEEKETKIIETLKEEELEELKNKLMSKYDLTFDGLFLPKYFFNKELPLCLLRVYHLIFDEVKFKELQSYSKINRKETNDIIGMPYIDNLKKKDELIHQFEKMLLLNAISLKEEERFSLMYLYYTKEKEIWNGKKLLRFKKENEQNWNEIKEILFMDIEKVIENIVTKSGIEKEDSLRLLQNFLITTDLNGQETIINKIKEKVNKENWDEDKIKYLNIILSFFKIEPIKQEKKKREPTKVVYRNDIQFTAYELIKFQEYYQKLTGNTLNIWNIYFKIVESKRKKEEKKKREDLYNKLNELLEKENKLLNNIKEPSEFFEFVSIFYSEDNYFFPFYNIYIANQIKASTLESKETIIKMVRFRLERIIGELELSNENNFLDTQTYLENLLLDEEEEEKSVYITRLEEIIKALIAYNLNLITEESLLETLEDLDFEIEERENEKGKILDILYSKYITFLKEYIEIHEHSKFKTILYHSLYILYFLDENLNMMIKEDFEVPTINEDWGLELSSDIVEFLKIYVEENLNFHSETLPITKGMNLSLSIYLKALKELIKEKDIKELKNGEMIKKLKKKELGEKNE